jgi:ClpP class serine protease
MSIGNTEVAEALNAYGDKLCTWTDSMMASAAYNIGVIGRKIGCTASAMVGSIGVILPYIDESGAWEMQGIEAKPITNAEGVYKATGYKPSMTAMETAYMQGIAQELFNQFKANVLSKRMVPDEAMRGQVLVGQSALDNNLVDFIGSYQDFYNGILK